MQRCFQEPPRLSQLLYDSRAAATLSLEDPRLEFYLRKLDWRALARASGHRSVQFHPIDGPLFAPPSSRRGGAPRGGVPQGGAPTCSTDGWAARLRRRMPAVSVAPALSCCPTA
ncbi:uncharacterized protein SOCE26_074270 [Sorangium cellulosum]|uniref:Uncharacterized protein n=1 Tax=Sorangium cellulosum TaxID=56 RepID=A0A2L0F2X2_SORCE|nr:hypothetical protein [Sorangium cellulosum]AUX45925.1 uncharacterized protein SOCE26_074270 [Sorangium cellulosum]